MKCFLLLVGVFIQISQKGFVALIFFLGILLGGCGKVNNSSTTDTPAAEGSSEFVAAKQVLQEKCLECHATWTNYSEAEFISNNLVTKRSPSGSSIYTTIRGNDTGIAGNMPLGQGNLSQSEINTMKSWINSIQ